jgi:hypothetical protein
MALPRDVLRSVMPQVMRLKLPMGVRGKRSVVSPQKLAAGFQNLCCFYATETDRAPALVCRAHVGSLTASTELHLDALRELEAAVVATSTRGVIGFLVVDDVMLCYTCGRIELRRSPPGPALAVLDPEYSIGDRFVVHTDDCTVAYRNLVSGKVSQYPVLRPSVRVCGVMLHDLDPHEPPGCVAEMHFFRFRTDTQSAAGRPGTDARPSSATSHRSTDCNVGPGASD